MKAYRQSQPSADVNGAGIVDDARDDAGDGPAPPSSDDGPLAAEVPKKKRTSKAAPKPAPKPAATREDSEMLI
jgi:hypothetical protein